MTDNDFDGLVSGEYNAIESYNCGEITMKIKAVVVVESLEHQIDFESELQTLLNKYAI